MLQRFDYLWMQGPPKEPDGVREGVCYKSSVFYSVAKSPAFDISGMYVNCQTLLRNLLMNLNIFQ